MGNATGGAVGGGTLTPRASCGEGANNLGVAEDGGGSARYKGLLSLDMASRLETQQDIKARHQVQRRREIEGRGVGDMVEAREADASMLRSANNTVGYREGKRRWD